MLDLKEIYFSYRQSNSQEFTLEKINISINAGEFVGIFGPNGSGKSTLLKIMSGILKPGKGRVLLNNQPIAGMNRRVIASKIAFVPQFTSTIFPFTVYEIVAMGRSPHLGLMGFESETDNKKILEAIEKLELTSLCNKGINEISGGEAQRTYIARAIAQEPEIILLDEPNSHLDLKHQISIYNLLRNLNEELDITIISVSHDLNLSAYFCKRGILLDKGRVINDGVISEILTERNIRNVFDINTKVEINGNQDITVILKP